MAKKENGETKATATKPEPGTNFPGIGWAVGLMKPTAFNTKIVAHSLPDEESALKRAGNDDTHFVLHIDKVLRKGVKPTVKKKAAEPTADAPEPATE